MNDKDVKILNIEELLGKYASDYYVVPLYQREYAWGAMEICQLLDDLWESFYSNPNRNYHLGTLIVCRRFHDGNVQTYELIDGQQRLTTLSLLYRIIKHVTLEHEKLKHASYSIPRKVRFDNRPMAENFLDAFFSNADIDAHDPASFREAVDIIAGYRYETSEDVCNDNSTKIIGRWAQIDSILRKQKGGVSFSEFILNKVKLFRVEMPSTTDVAAYFEVMNNRGQQLEFHELVKARLIAILRNPELRKKHNVEMLDIGEIEKRFDVFWTECAEMRGHLAQRLHDTLKMEINPCESWINTFSSNEKLNYSISEKLADYNNSRDDEPQSIIDDFPNFLMHALRIYCSKVGISYKDTNIPLDDRALYTVFRHYEEQIDPYEFLDCLIRVRLWFDRYIVKPIFEDKAVKEWRLEGIVKNDSGHYELVNTFSKDDSREKLIKLESMLQVTYRTRRYKNWLSSVLLNFIGKVKIEEEISAKYLINYLEKEVLLPRLMDIHPNAIDENGTPVFIKGTDTPHLIFNVIDYLLWCESIEQKKADKQSLLEDNDFVFAYRSSIEHHHAQQIFQGEDVNDAWNSDDFNNIGNLCLVYPNENSSLSNHSPNEKVLRYKKTNKTAPPKQQIMYSITLSEEGGVGNWTKKLMKDHSKYVCNLINSFMNNVTNRETLA